MPTVKIVEVARVAPPPEDLVLRLSPLDAPWMVIPLIQRVLLFDDPDGQLPPFASLICSLRASLTATLALFPPLAGRIVLLPSTGDAAIDCSASDSEGRGVRFVVAEMDDTDAGRLAGNVDHDVDAFKALVPELQTDALPTEVLAVQVTRLNGGVAVGVAMHHAVVDGRSVWRFLEAWAVASRGDVAVAAQTFDRAAVAVPGGEELARSTLRKYAPDLPLAPMRFPPGPNLPRRTFTFAAQHIHRLKQRISDLTVSPPSPQAATPALSSFVAIAALTWVSFVRSKHLDAITRDHDVYLFFFYDCRGRRGIDPPVSDNYFGTCITGCLAKGTARDLLEEDGIATAAAAVQREVRRAAENPLALWDWMDIMS
ncbi:unnamed protein product [Alopecurus aequalis]